MRPFHINQKISYPKTFFVLIIIVSMFSFSTISANSAEKPAEKKQRPDVMFLDEYHDLHMESANCLDCHHIYENGENILDEGELEDGEAETSCSSCHTPDATLNLEKAYHQQCMGCHNKMKKAKEKTGPSLCGECHIRKK